MCLSSGYFFARDGCEAIDRLRVDGFDVVPEVVGINLSEAGSSGSGVLFMLNPNKTVAVTDAETRALQSFVQNGGSLVLANDFGNANAVLSGLGVANEARFNGSLLSDNVSKGVDQAHPLITDISPLRPDRGRADLYFNYGTPLNVSGSTSPFSRGARRPATCAPRQATTRRSPGAPAHTRCLPRSRTARGASSSSLTRASLSTTWLAQADNQRLFTDLIANLTGGDTSRPRSSSTSPTRRRSPC